MRKRFRGNKPIGLNQELDGQGGAGPDREVPMLYAGKPAGGGGVRQTSGDEEVKGQ
jgi:hypothetical protein